MACATGRLIDLRRAAAGLVCGLLCGVLATQALAQHGFPAAGAAIEHILVHIDRGAAHATFPVYRDLARHLSQDVRVTATVAQSTDAAGALELLTAAGFASHRVEVVVANASITPWARDRVIALRGPSSQLLTPAAACVGLERLGDLESARHLAASLPSTKVVPTDLWLEGGNVIFDSDRAFVGSHFVALQNLGNREPMTDAQATQLLRSYLGTVVLIGDGNRVPHDHLDMFVTVVGERTVLLGDPRRAVPFLTKTEQTGFAGCLLPDFDVWSVGAQTAKAATYELIARQLEEYGMAVQRIPIVHGEAGGVLTWNNAIIEKLGGVRRAYVPVYGVPRLDDLALAAYRRAGCLVFPIDASRVVALGGAVRCLVNVVSWRSPGANSTPLPSNTQPTLPTGDR